MSRLQNGFTIVEVLVVVVVISILVASAWLLTPSYDAYMVKARDAERVSDTEGLARTFERYYRVHASTSGASYPTTTQITSSLGTVLDGAPIEITHAPEKPDGLVAANNATVPQSPGLYQYIYQPFTSAGTLCSTAPCVRFTLYYQEEKTNTVQRVESIRQQ